MYYNDTQYVGRVINRIFDNAVFVQICGLIYKVWQSDIDIYIGVLYYCDINRVWTD